MEEKMISGVMTRRDFVKASLMGTAALAFSSVGLPSEAAAQATGPFVLPPLPYAEDALAPVISAR
ncbi:MAG TPA: twin-arginine translocation signal domain-containing protein, partial [Syntrophales bacterium]|nr:twin-arginine translocation signal domain-containing protein [Syntrophales bacterium]